MTLWLKQSTTVNLKVGPFLNDTDGVTPETGLTPAAELSKNGAAFAARNSATAVSHDAEGWYAIELNATDTNTLGCLQLKSVEAGALPVWQDFMVVPANVYDSLIGGSDKLQIDAVEWRGTQPNNLISGRVDSNSILATDAVNAAAVAADAVLEVQSGLATSAELATLESNLSGDIAGVQTDVDNVQTRLPSALVSGRMDSNMSAINNSSAAAVLLALSAGTIVAGTAVSGTLSTTQMTTDLTEATNDHYNGRLIAWTSGALLGQYSNITDYDGTTKILTFTGITEAPLAGATFLII